MEEKEKIPFFPKNVRQIGQIEGNYKIYLEDYVITFLNQIGKKGEIGSKAVLLLGETYQTEESLYYIVYGAICAKKQRLEEGIALFEEEDREYLQEIKENYFKKYSVLGWAVVESQFNTISDDTVWKDMGQAFEKEGKLFIRINWEEKKQTLKIHKYNMINTVEGYYIFYDINEEMQNYLIQWHEEQQDTPMENVRDTAMKQFRSTVAEKKECVNQQKTTSFFYIASSLLLILMCAMGITMLNNYEKLKRVETAMNHLVESMEEEREILALQETEHWQSQIPEPPSQEAAMTEPSAREVMIPEPSVQEAAIPEPPIQEAAIPKPLTQEVSVQEASIQETQIQEEEYIVCKGDTLNSISIKFYQTAGKTKEICELNRISNPDNIAEGQKILLP